MTLLVVSILLLLVGQLHLEFLKFDGEATEALFRHPELSAVTARVRQDVLSTVSYPGSFKGLSQSPTRLILRVGIKPPVTAVWEFDEESVTRRQFVGGAESSSWRATRTPAFEVSAIELVEGGRLATRLTARDREGRLVYDGVFQPRIH